MEPNLKNSILEKIEKGEVSMRPRLYFVFQIILIAVLSIIAALLSVFVFSFILFSLRQSGEQLLLGFGFRGFLTLIGLFPWVEFVLVIMLLVAIEMLLRKFRFGYRTPIFVALAVAFAGALLIGLLVNFTPLHSDLLNQADRGELPVIGELYETVHTSHWDHGVYRGVVTSIAGNQFVISHDDNDKDTDDGTWTIIAPTGFNTASLQTGERVFVAGSSVATGTVQAYGIEPYTGSQEMK